MRDRKIAMLLAAVVCAGAASSSSGAEDAPDQVNPKALRAVGNVEYDRAVERYLQKTVKKIVGGMVVARDGAYPWQASLGAAWIPNVAQAHYCGGSIYNNKWILTAAHCLTNVSPNDLTISVGTNHLQEDTVRLKVKNVIYHASYDAKSWNNDIGLVELAEPLQFSERIKAVDLASDEDEKKYLTPTTDDLVITGWGSEEERGSHVVDLRYATETFVPKEMCQMPLSYGKSITENMLCAGYRGRGTCDGDSGGPLFIDGARPILFGLTSFAKGCAEPLKFDVFTRVSRYLDWARICLTASNSTQCHKNGP